MTDATRSAPTATEILAFRVKCAAADLRFVRKNARLLIGQTVQGCVELLHVEGVYSLTTQGVGARVLAKGAPAVVRPVLAALYQVEA